jgi:hypothetical protein
MGTQRAQFEPFAWSLTREQIGQGLRERYPLLPEMPLQLLAAVWKLDTAEASHLADKRGWLRKLDAIEGSKLFRACSKRVRSLPMMRSSTSSETRYGDVA